MYDVDPYQALQELKHPVVFTHFKSAKRIKNKKVYCRISEGMIDYVPILKWLNKKYNGFYALEYEETSDVFTGSRDDYETLKTCLNLVEKE